MRLLEALLLLPAALGAAPQSDYRPALPGYRYEFPRDHGNHADFKLEWWYFTGNLESTGGRRFGYELTFFRTGLEEAVTGPSSWQARDLYPAHFALSDLDTPAFVYFEKLNRTSPGIAGAEPGRLEVWNENWTARMESGRIHLRASQGDTAIDLQLKPTKPPVIHGVNGVSRKGSGPGRASHYYSLTRLQTSGTLRTPQGPYRVEGLSWMDHEFSTNQLEPQQTGWDWFSLQLDSGEELMLFQIRREDGAVDRHSSGTRVSASGDARHIGREEFELVPEKIWESPHTGGRYPVQWRILLPGDDTELRVEALLNDQELRATRSTGVAYWEGAVRVRGRWRGREASGLGYLEMTGYAAPFRLLTGS